MCNAVCVYIEICLLVYRAVVQGTVMVALLFDVLFSYIISLIPALITGSWVLVIAKQYVWNVIIYLLLLTTWVDFRKLWRGCLLSLSQHTS
jgi:hypothetical protein